MKNAIIALTFSVVAGVAFTASIASATSPDLPPINAQTQIRYEKRYISESPEVKAYVASLGGIAFVVTFHKSSNLLYTVITDNGCTFDVELFYNPWPGIGGLTLSPAACN